MLISESAGTATNPKGTAITPFATGEQNCLKREYWNNIRYNF